MSIPKHEMHMSDESLRDYYAGKAIAAIIAGKRTWSDIGYKPKNGFDVINNNCICAYEYADAMIKVRKL